MGTRQGADRDLVTQKGNELELEPQRSRQVNVLIVAEQTVTLSHRSHPGTLHSPVHKAADTCTPDL